MKNPPEYKPFRVAVAVIYIVVTGFICGCLFYSGYRGAQKRMGEPPELAPREAVDPSAMRRCMAELDDLYAELYGKLEATLSSSPARRSSVEWDEWSPDWRTRLLQAGAPCRLSVGDVPGTAEMKVAYDRLFALHRHYTTLAVQFSKEIGPHSDKLHQAMEKARRSVPAAAP
ncbi:MAG: hypothetical protein ACOX6T_27460 [Myxococcales bacterium]